MIEIEILNPHWLESVKDPDFDLCVHSRVRMKLAQKVVSDEESGEWTISASAYLFLLSLREDHIAEKHEQLLPHCAFNFWRINGRIIFSNCEIGLNWDIITAGEKTTHTFGDGEKFEISFGDWRDAVTDFSDRVLNFYETSSPRKFYSVEAQTEFEAFYTKLKNLRLNA